MKNNNAHTRQNSLNQVIVSALKGCTSSDLIADTFEKYSIKQASDRITYLNAAMGNPITFFSAENPSIDIQYEVTFRMFTAGNWRLNELYEKAGL